MGGSVLHFDAAKDGRAFYEKPLQARGLRIRLNGLVRKAAEDAVALDDHAPGLGNADFDAGKHGADLERGGISRHISAAKIDLVAAEYGVDMATGEVLGVDVALAAAEHGGFPHQPVM